MNAAAMASLFKSRALIWSPNIIPFIEQAEKQGMAEKKTMPNSTTSHILLKAASGSF
jgi:hypothetical protein